MGLTVNRSIELHLVSKIQGSISGPQTLGKVSGSNLHGETREKIKFWGFCLGYGCSSISKHTSNILHTLLHQC